MSVINNYYIEIKKSKGYKKLPRLHNFSCFQKIHQEEKISKSILKYNPTKHDGNDIKDESLVKIDMGLFS